MEEKNVKMSYEELEKNYASAIRANMQLQQAYKQAESSINGLQMTTMRLEFLFKVLNCSLAKDFDAEFIKSCIKEVQELMRVEEAKEEEK